MTNLLQPTRLLTGAVLLLLVLPSVAFAQTASRAQFYPLRGWGQSGELQQKISALGSVAVQAVPMPVLFGVTPANLTPNFGDPRDGGARSHEGEDIMATKGTPIVSPTPAVVLRTGVGGSEGNYVYTANPGGETFVYMHLDRIGEGVASGSELQTGSLIGYVGNTGNASGGAAHLHFEVHNSSGAPTDPYPRLSSAQFTPEQKLSFLNVIFGVTTDPVALSQFLASNFRSTFVADTKLGLTLPPLITGALGAPAASAAQSAPVVSPLPTVPGGALTLTRNLYRGLSGADVLALQRFLNQKGFTVSTSGAGSPGSETIYFGAATEAAVARFQAAQSIAPAVGYVGVLTRAALSAVG